MISEDVMAMLGFLPGSGRPLPKLGQPLALGCPVEPVLQDARDGTKWPAVVQVLQRRTAGKTRGCCENGGEKKTPSAGCQERTTKTARFLVCAPQMTDDGN
ncbi:MAG: hypothetical protein WCZ18_03410 [Ottowia sp.]|nr:hypothetical protein [Ottowia sp.]